MKKCFLILALTTVLLNNNVANAADVDCSDKDLIKESDYEARERNVTTLTGFKKKIKDNEWCCRNIYDSAYSTRYVCYGKYNNYGFEFNSKGVLNTKYIISFRE